MIDVPDTLDEEQQAAVDALSKVLNGNPRAHLITQFRSWDLIHWTYIGDAFSQASLSAARPAFTGRLPCVRPAPPL